ncbi:hypothetical protein V8F06_011426 [Rhypophila decipiens]
MASGDFGLVLFLGLYLAGVLLFLLIFHNHFFTRKYHGNDGCFGVLVFLGCLLSACVWPITLPMFITFYYMTEPGHTCCGRRYKPRQSAGGDGGQARAEEGSSPNSFSLEEFSSDPLGREARTGRPVRSPFDTDSEYNSKL